MAEPRACTRCAHHLLYVDRSLAPGTGIHLCTVREAVWVEPDEHGAPYEDDEREATFLGWSCDRARRMGELCGPAGHLWWPRDAAAPSVPQRTLQGREG